MRQEGGQCGMSLVELMIALVVVSILLLIGRSQYIDYRLRSIDAEGKVLLTQIYAANKTFKSHFNQYFGDWRNIGFQANGLLRGRVGFTTSTGGSSPAAPASYRGPGVAAGEASERHNSSATTGGCQGGLCSEDPNFMCFLMLDCEWDVDNFKACFSRASKGTPPRRHIVSINEAGVVDSETTTAICM